MSRGFLSTATDGVMDEVTAWQNRPLETLYPLVVFVALRVTIFDQGPVQNKAVHRALSIRADGQNESCDVLPRNGANNQDSSKVSRNGPRKRRSGDQSVIAKVTSENLPANGPSSASRKSNAVRKGSLPNAPQPHAPRTRLS